MRRGVIHQPQYLSISVTTSRTSIFLIPGYILISKRIMAPFAFASAKTALITGGASGIGLAVAKKCLGHGMKVLIADRNTSLLAAAKEVSGGELSIAEVDVAREEDWATLQKRVDADFGGKSAPSAT
jgi:short subunit dehydrogenase